MPNTCSGTSEVTRYLCEIVREQPREPVRSLIVRLLDALAEQNPEHAQALRLAAAMLRHPAGRRTESTPPRTEP